MRTGESIGFSTKLGTFFADQHRLFTSHLVSEGMLTYNEATLLGALHEAGSALAAEPLVNFLMLSSRTVRSMLLDLEDKEFIAKLADPIDGRFMLVELTERGREAIESTVADLFYLMKEAYWEALPESDFDSILKMEMRRDVNKLRGCAVVPFGEVARTTLAIPSDFFVFWRVVVERWSCQVRVVSRLSLGDFRVLRYLDECGPLGPSVVADALSMQRSSLSLSKKRLIERGLVSERRSGIDGRRMELVCEAQGKRLSKRLFDELDQITRDVHSGMSEEDASVVEAWYARMCSNMKRRAKASLSPS